MMQNVLSYYPLSVVCRRGKIVTTSALLNLFANTDHVFAQATEDRNTQKQVHNIWNIGNIEITKISFQHVGKSPQFFLRLAINDMLSDREGMLKIDECENGECFKEDYIDLVKGDAAWIMLENNDLVMFPNPQINHIQLMRISDEERQKMKENPMQYIISCVIEGKQVAPTEEIKFFTRSLSNFYNEEVEEALIARLKENNCFIKTIQHYNYEKGDPLIVRIKNEKGYPLVAFCFSYRCDYLNNFYVVYNYDENYKPPKDK